MFGFEFSSSSRERPSPWNRLSAAMPQWLGAGDARLDAVACAPRDHPPHLKELRASLWSSYGGLCVGAISLAMKSFAQLPARCISELVCSSFWPARIVLFILDGYSAALHIISLHPLQQ